VVVDQEGNIRERITEEFSGRQDILGQLDQAIEVQRAERESNRQNSNPSFTFY
jgi:hypothetical protein